MSVIQDILVFKHVISKQQIGCLLVHFYQTEHGNTVQLLIQIHSNTYPTEGPLDIFHYQKINK